MVFYGIIPPFGWMFKIREDVQSLLCSFCMYFIFRGSFANSWCLSHQSLQLKPYHSHVSPRVISSFWTYGNLIMPFSIHFLHNVFIIHIPHIQIPFSLCVGHVWCSGCQDSIYQGMEIRTGNCSGAVVSRWLLFLSGLLLFVPTFLCTFLLNYDFIQLNYCNRIFVAFTVSLSSFYSFILSLPVAGL